MTTDWLQRRLIYPISVNFRPYLLENAMTDLDPEVPEEEADEEDSEDEAAE